MLTSGHSSFRRFTQMASSGLVRQRGRVLSLSNRNLVATGGCPSRLRGASVGATSRSRSLRVETRTSPSPLKRNGSRISWEVIRRRDPAHFGSKCSPIKSKTGFDSAIFLGKTALPKIRKSSPSSVRWRRQRKCLQIGLVVGLHVDF
jgi:hypothetical protein